MSKDKAKKKGMGWFKTSSSSADQAEQNHLKILEPANEMMTGEQSNDLTELEPSNADFLSKDNQDKLALDALVSLENILKDRQLTLYQNKALEEQIYTLNEIVNRLKEDLVKKDQNLQEKGREIRTLENNLTKRQMGYDQLLEDYKEYQNTSNLEYDNISNLLNVETNKYNKLSEESANAQYQSLLKTNNLEEKIRNLEIDNQRYIEDYQKVLNEKQDLMQTINDFTEKMSFSFSPKTDISSSED